MWAVGGGRGLSAAALKYLACLSMLLDHIGLLLFPQSVLLRDLGRLAFPIFAFMLANGYLHTANYWRYLLRLVLFAAGFQWFFAWIVSPHYLNIFATLALSLIAIRCGDELRRRLPQAAGQAACLAVGALFCLIGELIQVDYYWYGVALSYTAWLFFDQPKLLALAWLLLTLAVSWPIDLTQMSQIFALAALLPLGLYNGERGRGGRWFFYIFYCAHLLVLYLLQLWLF